MNDLPRTSLLLLLLLFVLAALSTPSLRHINNPYEKDYHGNLTAWFAMMSENMEQSGFLETRFMPPLNPNVAEFPKFRFYLTHPVLDVVLRAGFIRLFGRGEWVSRIQGILGCFGAAILLFFVLRPHMDAVAAFAGAVFMCGLPLFQRLAHLSMQHPMTLLFAMAALLAYQRHVRTRTRGSMIWMLVLAFLGMNFDWPGYFMPALILLLALGSQEPMDFRRGIVTRLVLLVAAGLTLFLLHAWIAGTPPAELVRTIRNASQITEASPSFSEGLGRVLEFQWRGMSGWGLLICLAAAPALLLLRSSRKTRLLWSGLLLYGLLNIALFPAKAPLHDFWGCYWLPFAGMSAGLVVAALGNRLGTRVQHAAAALLVLGAITQAWTIDRDPQAIEAGRQHRKIAADLLEVIPEGDRGILITNSRQYDLQILMTYMRTTVIPLDTLSVASLDEIPRRIRKLAYHIQGARVLLYLDTSTLEDQVAAAKIQSRIQQVGSSYRDLPSFFDITEFAWSGD